ncbi:MAG TPA: hypothetical protein VGY57_00815, partial [Vicinamibacterales bacterium]|nr:hypothetical protein [Vicinamibacterales bacterium]
RFRHYVGLEQEAIKLALLLAQFRFGTARDVLEQRQPTRTENVELRTGSSELEFQSSSSEL